MAKNKAETVETFDATIAEFADRVRCDRTLAYGLIKYLEKVGSITKVSDRPSPSGKGKPSGVYRFPVTLTLTF